MAAAAAAECVWKKYFADPSEGDNSDKNQVLKESLLRDGERNPPPDVRKREPTERNEDHFHQMRVEGPFNVVALLKDYAKQKNLVSGSKLHAYVREHKFLENNCYVASALITMYARCGALAKAQQVFDHLPVPCRDVVTWNALIAGYAQQGQANDALKCFNNLQREGHSPNAVTFVCVLKACGSIGAAAAGEQIHDKIVSLGLLENNVVLGSSLVDMYARCGALTKAQRVLSELPVQNVVAWNALITRYAEQGQGEEALKCFDNMQLEGHSPNLVTFICVLKACGSIGAAAKGKQIHDTVVSLGMLDTDIILGNALVDMYAKCGALAKAQQVLYELPARNVVTWNALIAAYVQQDQGEEALKCFASMQKEGHSPDRVTFTCALKACGSLGAAEKGEQIHDKLVSLRMLEKDILLGSTLVDMYARCGRPLKAQEVLDKLSIQDVVAWTALIAGYAQLGQIEETLNCLEMMQSKGVQPDSTTILCVLNACSHSGLLDHAEIYVLRISMHYGITLTVEHYCCMVDLFGRAGKFNKALIVIEKMQPAANALPVWLSLLGACCKWGDVKIGRLAFQGALCFDKCNGLAHVCMANVYMAAGMQEDAHKVEVMRGMSAAWKVPGWLLVEHATSSV